MIYKSIYLKYREERIIFELLELEEYDETIQLFNYQFVIYQVY